MELFRIMISSTEKIPFQRDFDIIGFPYAIYKIELTPTLIRKDLKVSHGPSKNLCDAGRINGKGHITQGYQEIHGGSN